MSTRDLIICAVFISGAAVFYGTEKTCTEVAANFDGALVREVSSFAELV
jgi:hypothetical protein